MPEPSHAVFLSYASQDAEAAQTICEALRAAGIEVWFDQSALRGGDVWDQAIRKQIKTCVLFIPVISRHTHDRDEGYFRLEWKLAVDRSHLMTSSRAFLLPVVIDETREDDENVPDRFKDIHWTRLPAGETPSAFVERVRRLVSPDPTRATTESALPAGPPRSAATSALRERAPGSSRSKRALAAIVAVVVAGTLAYFTIERFWVVKRQASPTTPPAPSANVAPTAFAPPPHSIAVLPFVNMSGDKEQEYFSDGLSEELLNDLSRITELQVAGRTSSFYFKGKDVDLSTIAHKLNVGSVLEGSVRRSGHTVRVTAQLINAVTGFHLWSETYDRDLGDVLKLQTEIAQAVAGALKVMLLSDVATKIEVGGTRNPAAFDAYLRATKTYFGIQSEKDAEAALAGYTEAIRLDSDYALGYAARSLALVAFGENWVETVPALRAGLDKALADARKAVALAPNLGEGHTALGRVYDDLLEFTRASEEFEHARALAPGNARVLWNYGDFAVRMGRTDSGLTALRRAVALDPLNAESHYRLGLGLYILRRYAEAMAAFRDSESLRPGYVFGIGVVYYLLADYQNARSSCEKLAIEDLKAFCLAMVYDKLGRHADAEAMLTKVRALDGDVGALEYVAVYAQWGDTRRALDWLETAMRLRIPDLKSLKDPLFDPLRKEPRFQAIERELKFPS